MFHRHHTNILSAKSEQFEWYRLWSFVEPCKEIKKMQKRWWFLGFDSHSLAWRAMGKVWLWMEHLWTIMLERSILVSQAQMVNTASTSSSTRFLSIHPQSSHLISSPCLMVYLYRMKVKVIDTGFAVYFSQGRLIPCDFIGIIKSQQAVNLQGRQSHKSLWIQSLEKPLYLNRTSTPCVATTTRSNSCSNPIFFGYFSYFFNFLKIKIFSNSISFTP